MEMVSTGFGALFCNLGHLGTIPLLGKYLSGRLCPALEEDKTEQPSPSQCSFVSGNCWGDCEAPRETGLHILTCSFCDWRMQGLGRDKLTLALVFISL